MTIKTQDLKVVKTGTPSKESWGSMIKMPWTVKFKIDGAGFTAFATPAEQDQPSERSVYSPGVKCVAGTVENGFNPVHFSKLPEGFFDYCTMGKADGVADNPAAFISHNFVPLAALNYFNCICAFKPGASQFHSFSNYFPFSTFSVAVMWARSIWSEIVAGLACFTVLKRHSEAPYLLADYSAIKP